MRVGVSTCVFALLLVPVATGAWDQAGGNGARTFSADGPLHEEVAFMVDLPAARVAGRPLLLGPDAAFLLLETPATPAGTAGSSIHGVNLTTGKGAEIVALPYVPTGWAMDAERFYVGHRAGLTAFGLDGQQAWTWSYTALGGVEQAGGGCLDPAVGEGGVFAACYTSALPSTPLSQNEPDSSIVVALDARNGTERWRLPYNTDNNGRPLGVILKGPELVTVELRQSTDYHAHVMGWDISTGACRWFVRHFWKDAASPDNPAAVVTDLQQAATMTVSVVATERELLVHFGELRGYSVPATAQICHDAEHALPEDWSAAPVGQALGRSSLAYSLRNLFVAEGRQLVRVGLDADRALHPMATTEGAFEWSPGGIMAGTTGRVYAFSHDTVSQGAGGSATTIAARLDAFGANGTVAWSREFSESAPDPPALADGLLAYTAIAPGRSQQLVALGRAKASIQPDILIPDLYPAVGKPARLDLTGTRAGALSATTDVRVEWDDGAAADQRGLGTGGVFEHTYDEPGDRIVRIVLSNEAGQSAVEERTLHVGGVPPPQPVTVSPDFVTTQFAPENQNRTYFLLGVAATAAGGLWGLLRLQRKRARLRKEMARLDDAYQRLRGQPDLCEDGLREAHVRLRRELAEGRLEEAQFSVLDRHLEHLQRQGRLDLVEEELGFLPMAMVKHLKGLLGDGRIERWERRHFVDALDRDHNLTAAQRARVRKLVDGWLARDEKDGAGRTGA